MTKDEVMLAFRMIAMGRPATPVVEQLADLLLSLAPAPAVVQEPEVFEVAVPALEIELPDVPNSPGPSLQEHAQAVAKRGRKGKAD